MDAMEYKYSFEKLEVWNDARNLVKMIYLQTDNFPEKERFGLSSQMQRAAVSIVSNIAEGVSRSSVKEKIRFVELAYGSLMELYCQLYVSVDLDYLTPDTFTLIKAEIDKIANKANALKRSFIKQLNDSTIKQLNRYNALRN
ncbi:S23 ribosomal protein [Bacteroidetes oral taxon 274 str. F0058]|nr:S23 ribosomal protein [Bacteroidetes oral taxon 274 str. F0058]